jgi:hypothetical protein
MLMTKVRAGDFVWLPKEEKIAILDTDWIPPRPWHHSGKIGVDGHVWYVSIDGNGFDGVPLIQPLQGEEYDGSRPSEGEDIAELHKTLAMFDLDIKTLYALVFEMRSVLQAMINPENTDEIYRSANQ